MKILLASNYKNQIRSRLRVSDFAEKETLFNTMLLNIKLYQDYFDNTKLFEINFENNGTRSDNDYPGNHSMKPTNGY